MRIPSTVQGTDQLLYADANTIRAEIKRIAELLDGLRGRARDTECGNSEVVANATLAYRHLEDASMRLGKMLQALDGGVSVYDARTTVGAPDAAEGPSGLITHEVGTPRRD